MTPHQRRAYHRGGGINRAAPAQARRRRAQHHRYCLRNVPSGRGEIMARRYQGGTGSQPTIRVMQRGRRPQNGRRKSARRGAMTRAKYLRKRSKSARQSYVRYGMRIINNSIGASLAYEMIKLISAISINQQSPQRLQAQLSRLSVVSNQCWKPAKSIMAHYSGLFPSF